MIDDGEEDEGVYDPAPRAEGLVKDTEGLRGAYTVVFEISLIWRLISTRFFPGERRRTCAVVSPPILCLCLVYGVDVYQDPRKKIAIPLQLIRHFTPRARS
jgi:hypothetical protein